MWIELWSFHAPRSWARSHNRSAEVVSDDDNSGEQLADAAFPRGPRDMVVSVRSHLGLSAFEFAFFDIDMRGAKPLDVLTD